MNQTKRIHASLLSFVVSMAVLMTGCQTPSFSVPGIKVSVMKSGTLDDTKQRPVRQVNFQDLVDAKPTQEAEVIEKPSPASMPNSMTQSQEMIQPKMQQMPVQPVGQSPTEMQISDQASRRTGNQQHPGQHTPAPPQRMESYLPDQQADNYQDYYRSVKGHPPQRSNYLISDRNTIQGEQLPNKQMTATEHALFLRQELARVNDRIEIQSKKIQQVEADNQRLTSELKLTVDALAKATETNSGYLVKLRQAQQENVKLRASLVKLTETIANSETETEEVLSKLRSAIRGQEMKKDEPAILRGQN